MHASALTTATLITITALTLTACNSSGGQKVDTTTNPNGPTQEAEPAPQSGALNFGDTWQYDNGIELTVSKPSQVTPHEWASPQAKKDQTALGVKITIVNNSGEAYDPSTFYSTASGGSDGQECEGLFDSENGYNGTPETTIQAGRKATFKTGYVCTAQPGDPFTMDVQADVIAFDEPVLFDGTIPK